MHGSNRLGGNSLSDLLVFGRRAGLGAADYVASLERRPTINESDVDAAARMAVASFDPPDDGLLAENPYTLHGELQQAMNDLVGIIRTAEEVEQALGKLAEIKQRIRSVSIEGHRQFNPGWHLAIDLRNMVLVSECVARAALMRTESRGGHTRDDHPQMDPVWRNKLLVCRAVDDGDPVVPAISVTGQPQQPMRSDLIELFELAELEKYYTEDELASHPGKKS
jgi:succinate dehydrogenase / fumarate reductase flavoprotein subunit